MNKNVTDSSMRERMIYNQVLAKLKDMYPSSYNDFIISPSYLRSEQAFTSTKSNYQFDIKKVGNEVATEIKLDRNDLFVVSRWGMFLSNQNPASIGKEVPQSYPNLQVFPAVAGSVAADLEAFYNGSSSLKIANRVNIENLSNQEFRYVPSTQQSSAANKSEMNLSDACYKPASTIYLHGTMDIQVSTQFPSYVGIGLTPADPTVNGTNKMVLMYFGFLIKGAASNK